MLGLNGGKHCLPFAGAESLPCSRRFCIGKFATGSVLWKNRLGSWDDEVEQRNLQAGLGLLQLSGSDLVTPDGQEQGAGKEGKDLGVT